MIGRLRQEESGWALVTAVIVMTLLLGIGLAGLSLVDGQARQSGRERVGESAFNLADAVLKSQVLLVSRGWPGSVTSAFPGTCSSTVQGANCPDAATLAAQFAGSDYSGASWTASVQDNGGSVGSYYTSAGAASQPAYDANGDGKLWVRASATSRGATRSMVTLVAATAVPIPFPNVSVLADHFATTNAGSKVIVDTNGSTYVDPPGQPGPVAVRCAAPAPSTCLNYDPSKPQVSPDVPENNYPTLTAVTADRLDQMRGLAKQAGNTCGASGSSQCYYPSGCPADPSGALVFIESGNCTANGGTYNSLASPGKLVIANGTFSLGGNALFNGLVYAANLQNSTGNVVSLTGTSEIVGAVAVDGPGGVLAGSAGPSIAYNPNVFSLVQGYGNATPVKGTWRELVG